MIFRAFFKKSECDFHLSMIFLGSSDLDQLGLDMPSYLRMCVSRLVRDRGIPFSMKIDEAPENRGVSAMKRASRIAEENGISDMTLDEINAEIAEARK